MPEATGISEYSLKRPPGEFFGKKAKPKQPQPQQPVPKQQVEHRPNIKAQKPEDEFSNQDVPILEPLKQVIVSKDQGFKSYTEQGFKDYMKMFEEEFKYLSRTRGLEVNTPRTQILQDIVDKMTEGTNLKTRVVIMNRGLDANAFTTADGTIFVTQSLINSLESMDEIGGVLAHEVGHLVFRTFETKQNAPDKLCEFGASWVYELSSDLKAPQLLVKAGLKSNGFSEAISKIGFERGTIHQAGLMRSAQNIALHAVLDYETSNIAETGVNQFLQTAEVPLTNYELFIKSTMPYPEYDTREILLKLHPRDFLKAHNYLTINEYADHINLGKLNKLEVLQDVVRERLTEKGYTENDIDLLFLLSQGSGLASFRFIETPERLVELTSNLQSFIDEKKLVKMYGTVFEGDLPHMGGDSIQIHLLKNLKNHIFDPALVNREGQKYGIPVTQDSLLQVISQINSLPDNYFEHENKSAEITRLIEHYLDDVLELRYKTDYDKAKEILLKAKELNLPIDSELISKSSWAKQIYVEIFGGKEEEIIDLNSITDEFIESYFNGSDSEREKVFNKYRLLLITQLQLQNGGDAKLLSALEYFVGKLDSRNIEITYSIPHFLESGDYKEATAQENDLNQKIFKFNLKTMVALGTFKTDSPEFYSFISKSMQELGIDPKTLSKNQLVNLCTNLISDTGHFLLPEKENQHKLVSTQSVWLYSQSTKIRNYDKFSDLLYIRELMDRKDNLSFTNLKELNQYMTDSTKNHFHAGFESIYGDSFRAIVLGKEVRSEFERLLTLGIGEEEYTDLYEFISKHFPPSPQEQEFLRELNKRYLESEKPTIEEKIAHFKRNADQLGPEGAIMVGDQITTMREYVLFRDAVQGKVEEYISGESEKVGTVAAVDNLTSELVKNFKTLLRTSEIDPKSKAETMSEIAKMWVNVNIEHGAYGGITYDKKSRKIVLEGKARDGFKTLADVVKYLRNRTSLQKFLLSQKALLDKDGALTSDENRKFLSQTLVSALNPDSSFVAKALKIGAEKISPDYLSFPASQIFSSILFEGLDMNAVRSTSFTNNTIPASEAQRIARSGTREVVFFGARYSQNPNTEIAKNAQISDAQYNEAVETLNMLLGSSEAERQEGNLPSSTEAIIRGVEMSGALGVRSLQLARQLHKFSPDLDQRLSQSFDARPGMSKLSFWEHLYNANGKNGIGDFVSTRLVSVDEFLGGGSLYTTYAATVKTPSGKEQRVALKMLNPNAEMFIQRSYEEAKKILDEIKRTGNSQERQYAEISQLFLDLSNSWCVKDIQDPTFEKDDAKFREIIASYNQARGENTVYAPELVLNTPKLKSEGKAEGRTLNQILNDPRVPELGKRRAVDEVAKFYEYQLQTPVRDENGQVVHLIHSDPHIGNFIVGFDEGSPKIGVIDRNMYLKMKPEDVEIFRPLIQGRSYSSMLEPMINRLLDIGNITDPKTREARKKTIINGVRKEFFIQTWNSLRNFRIGVNNFSLLRRFMEESTHAGVTIPLGYQLMIRNVEAFRELQKRYARPS